MKLLLKFPDSPSRKCIFKGIFKFFLGENPVALHLGFTLCLLPMGIFHRKKSSGNFLNSEFHPGAMEKSHYNYRNISCLTLVQKVIPGYLQRTVNNYN
jgi:hypothetical protein